MPSALSTDLYELTMAAGYFAGGVDEVASFELYVRDLPPNRSYLVAAGLEQALHFLETLRFSDDEIAYLRRTPNLEGAPDAFFDRFLAGFRFAGEVCAVDEGTPIFPHEPLLRVTAPILQAQIVETALLNIVTFQTSVASKAARVVEAAAGRPVIEFGSRRAHGPDAALHAARAAYLAGCDGTSNVEAGFRFGIPVSGTMAHSWVMAFEDEADAFRTYASVYGERSVLLLDTFDAVEAARKVVASGLAPAAVRLDSGDIAVLSREVRRVLDEGGLGETGIFVSGDLDEYKVAALIAADAPVSGFGVGTALSTVNDAPALGGIYKLVEVRRGGAVVPKMKLSPGKLSYPGRKQVWRLFLGGTAQRDLLGVFDEPGPALGRPLLAPVMEEGHRLRPGVPLADLRAGCRDMVAALPLAVRRIRASAGYPVEVSEALAGLSRRVRGEVDD